VLGPTFASEASFAASESQMRPQKAGNDDYSVALIERTPIALNPKNARALINRCAAYINLGNYGDAVADCTRAITLNPQNARAFINRCAAYIKLGNYGDAVADCTQAIALNPQNARAFNNRCTAYSRLANYTATIADCTRAIALNPTYKLAYMTRGIAHGRNKDYHRAIADYSEVIQLDPRMLMHSTAAAMPVPSSVNFRPHWRIARRRWSCSQTTKTISTAAASPT
jgi:tetratricopeptide (TPR) repeat protein